MMKRLLRASALGLAAATVLAGLVVATTPAQAADDPALTRVKNEVIRRIDLRLAALKRYDTAIGEAEHLTDGHEQTLDDLIAGDISALSALRTKVAGETTREAVRADATSMVRDYRIFLLVRPKVRLTIAGDREAAAIARLQAAHGKLADLVADAKAGGKDTAAAEQDLADMRVAIDKARNGLAGQLDTLLAIQPGPDGDAIRGEVSGVRQALGTARGDLRNALSEAKKVRDFLRSARPSPPPTS
jgi:hypothetical protein